MIKRILLAALLLVSGSAEAQLLTKFGPVNGVLVGTAGNPQTAAATPTNIIGLWSGCNGTNFLRGDGNCTVPTGTGVTSVGLTAPSWYTVTGSPVTSSGTLAIAAATGQTANLFLATPNGTTGAIAERAIVLADMPPVNLGSTANGGVLSTSILLGTNGGTSNGFFSVTGPATSLRTFTFPNASATVLTSNAAVTVAQGGTGLATLTANGVTIGEGTSSPNFIVMGADTLLRGTASADPVALAVNNCGSSTTALSYSTSTHTFGCQTITVGSGSVTSLTSGTAIVLSPSTITTTGSISLDTTASPTLSGTWTFGTNAPVFPVGFVGTGGSLNGSLTGTILNGSAGANAQVYYQAGNGTGGILVGLTGTGASVAPCTSCPTTSGSAFVAASGGGSLSIATNSTERIRIGNGNGSFAFHDSSTGLGFIAYGLASNNGTTCTISAGNATFGVASCSRTGTGIIVVTLSSSDTNSRTCTANTVGTAGYADITAAAAGTNTFTTFNTAGAATDISFNFVCF